MILSERLQRGRQAEIPFAFFDFDGTLTRSDTFMPFLHHCAGWRYYPKLLLVAPVLAGYLTKLVANDVAKEAVLTAFLRGCTETRLEKAACTFVAQELPRRLLSEGMQKLHEHQQQGHYCILVSASPELYLTEWARQQGFDGILGTRLAVSDGRLTGKLSGRNCFGEEKVVRIETEYGQDCWRDSFAYSDSVTDMPLLKRAANGFLWKKHIFQQI